MREAAAEGVGTGFIVMAVVGSGIMAERLAGGNGAIALLANALATVGALYVVILALTPVSGAHLNPAVTLVEALSGRIAWKPAALRVFFQFGGAMLGTLVAHAMFELPLLQQAARHREGSGVWIGEAVATFGLVLAIRLTQRAAAHVTPIAVAAYIGAAYWFTSSTSFANPAVTVARAMSDTFTGISPASVPGFIAMQILGALAAATVARALVPATDRSAATPPGRGS